MEEEIPGCPWKGMNAPEVGRVDTDPFGIYTITKVDPDLKERFLVERPTSWDIMSQNGIV